MSENQYLDPQPEALKKIKHIVVLMLENRSFDNLLGWLYDEEEPPRGQSYEGLNWNLWNPLGNFDSDGNPFVEKVGIRKNGHEYFIGRNKVIPKEPDFTLPNPDPGEGYRDTTYQLYQTYIVDEVYPPPAMAMGFVDNYKNAMLNSTFVFGEAPSDPRQIMTCYTPDQTPVLSTLAKKFSVCDQYFCSIPSQTLPNRDFVHAATSTGYVNNNPNNQCDAKTIYNQIQDAIDQGRDDLSWKIYNGTQLQNGKWVPFSLTRMAMVQIQDKKYHKNFDLMEEFYKDAKKGTLPSYSFLEPQFSGPKQNDQHPNTDIRSGEQLIADVYNALKKSPNWEETLFVVTYDEHGGCYDHYPPTEKASPPEDGNVVAGQLGFLFKRFGLRVPTVVVSPYIEEGTIARPSGYVPFDHASIIKTVQNCFELNQGKLTNRDANAPDLSCLLTLDKPRRDQVSVKPLRAPKINGNTVNELQHQCASILSELSGENVPEEEKDLFKFIHSTYKKHFHSKTSSHK